MGYSFAIIGSRGYPSTYGGFETLVRRLAPYLAAQGNAVTVYGRGRSHRGEQVIDGVRVILTRGMETTSLSTLTHGLTASVHARRQHYDAALVLNVANGYFLPILRSARIPTAVNVDGLEWRRDKWNAFGKAVFYRGAGLTARHASVVVADSKAIGEVWRDELGRDSVYIPYGADPSPGPPADEVRALGLEPGGYVLMVARLTPENNVGLFLDALERLGRDVPAVVVGSGRGSSVASVVSRLGNRAASVPTFRWLGHVDNQRQLTALWAHCGAYFHGHSVGGTNPGLLQALALGAPALALDTPYNAEVVGRNGRLVPADPAALAGRLRGLLADSSERARLAADGRGVISSRYIWDHVLESYRQLLVGMVEAQRHAP